MLSKVLDFRTIIKRSMTDVCKKTSFHKLVPRRVLATMQYPQASLPDTSLESFVIQNCPTGPQPLRGVSALCNASF